MYLCIDMTFTLGDIFFVGTINFFCGLAQSTRFNFFCIENIIIYTVAYIPETRRLDTITCAQKVGVLPHIKHYTKSESRCKALAAVLDEKVC